MTVQKRCAPGRLTTDRGAADTSTGGLLSAPILSQSAPFFKPFIQWSMPDEPEPLGSEHEPPTVGASLSGLPPRAPSKLEMRTRAALAGDLRALSNVLDLVTTRIEQHEQRAAYHADQARQGRAIRARLEALIPEGGEVLGEGIQ